MEDAKEDMKGSKSTVRYSPAKMTIGAVVTLFGVWLLLLPLGWGGEGSIREERAAESFAPLFGIPREVHVALPESGPLAEEGLWREVAQKFQEQHGMYTLRLYTASEMLHTIQQFRPDVEEWWQELEEEQDKFLFWKYVVLYFKGGVVLQPALLRDLVRLGAWIAPLSHLEERATQATQQGRASWLSRSGNSTPPFVPPRVILPVSRLLEREEQLLLNPFGNAPALQLSETFAAATPKHPLFQLAMDMALHSPLLTPYSEYRGGNAFKSDQMKVRSGSFLLSRVLEDYLAYENRLDTAPSPLTIRVDPPQQSHRAPEPSSFLSAPPSVPEDPQDMQEDSRPPSPPPRSRPTPKVSYDLPAIDAALVYHCCLQDVAIFAEKNLLLYLG
jgi:hypothetical protein